MRAIAFNKEDFPLVRIYFRGAPTDKEFDRYLRDNRELLERKQPYGLLLVTAPDLPMTRPRHARAQAQFMAEHRKLIQRRVRGIAFVLPSLVARGVLRTILGWQPMPCPHEVFKTEAEADAWLRERVGHAARDVPLRELTELGAK